MKKKVKNLGGRPTKYKPQYCEEMLEMARTGRGPTAFAAQIGVARSSLYEWAKDNKAFSDALERSKQLVEEYLVEMGMENMFSKDFNTKIWEMFLKCQHGWRDKDKTDTVINVKYEDKLKELE